MLDCEVQGTFISMVYPSKRAHALPSSRDPALTKRIRSLEVDITLIRALYPRRSAAVLEAVARYSNWKLFYLTVVRKSDGEQPQIQWPILAACTPRVRRATGTWTVRRRGFPGTFHLGESLIGSNVRIFLSQERDGVFHLRFSSSDI